MLKTSQLLFDFDSEFNKVIIGTDEAGRGPGAGGVFAAAVYFDKITEGLISDLAILNDSKKLTSKKRDSIFDIIKNNTDLLWMLDLRLHQRKARNRIKISRLLLTLTEVNTTTINTCRSTSL